MAISLKNKVFEPSIKNILIRYIITVVLSIGTLITVLYVPLALVRLPMWDKTDFFYRLFSIFYDKFGMSNIVIVGSFIILLTITLFYNFKLINYLNETIIATKKILVDPDKRVELTKVLLPLQEELNRIREKNNQAKRIAEEAERRKGELIVYLAHDLRTPLTSVIGYLTLLQEEPQISNDLKEKYTNIALDKATRLEELIGEFFEVTQFSLTTLPVKPVKVDLSTMLKQISYEFLPILEEKKLKWQLDIETSVEVYVDPNKVERVFDNLIRNAINYSFEDTTVNLSLKKQKNEAIFTLTNETHSIPQAKLNQFFEPFYRVDTSRNSNTGGAGLGLPISKEIIEASGGTIKVSSSDNKISFYVSLPLADK